MGLNDILNLKFDSFGELNFELKQALVAISVLLIVYYLISSLSKKNLKLPPGPRGVPILGYFPFLSSEPHKDFKELSKKYGNVFGLYLGRKYTVVLNDWESVTEVYSKIETTHRPPGFFGPLPNGAGFGAANGAEWAEQRRFTVKTMKDIGLGGTKWEELIQDEVNELATSIQKNGPGPLDVFHIFSSTFASNVMTLVFGERHPMDDPSVRLVGKCVDAVMQAVPTVGIGNFMPTLQWFLEKTGIKRSLPVKDLQAFGDFVKNRVQQRIKKSSETHGGAFVDEYYKEVVKREKSANHFFTEKYLVGNTQTLILGGSETSRTATIWLLVAMAENTDVQRKVHKELDNVLGRDGRIRYAEHSKILYTYATILESLRWRTLAPLNALRIVADDIKVGGYDVPKGTYIISNLWALHYDPKYWKDPEKFVPERFLTDDGKQLRKRDSFIPFSYGKRKCPGEMIALIEILIYFTTLMQKFEILPKEGDKVNYNSILGLTYQALDVELRFVPRE